MRGTWQAWSVLLSLPFGRSPNWSPYVTGSRQVVTRKLVETFYDMEEKGVMLFHLDTADRRSSVLCKTPAPLGRPRGRRY